MENLVQSMQLSCNLQIDYSTVGTDTILPFVIELDLEDSILNPGPLENQRFCYQLTGVGQDTPTYKDLSHWVLGICNEITENEITNITVTIDGVSQPVDFGPGGNVELRTEDQPDPPTGCAGLKFDFGLDKVTGTMEVCFELTTPYPIGSNSTCLFGGDVTASGLTICGPVCRNVTTCPSVAYQSASVCVPVQITPFANAGSSTTYCCGTPTITSGTSTCTGTVNGYCRFTLTQKICVAVPVVFGASASPGSPSVQCNEASSSDICSNCNITGSSIDSPAQSTYVDDEEENKQKKMNFNAHSAFHIKR